jgi:hypothetical protein
MGADDCLHDLHEEAQMELAVPLVGARPMTAGELLEEQKRIRERRERDRTRLLGELEGGGD